MPADPTDTPVPTPAPRRGPVLIDYGTTPDAATLRRKISP